MLKRFLFVAAVIFATGCSEPSLVRGTIPPAVTAAPSADKAGSARAAAGDEFTFTGTWRQTQGSVTSQSSVVQTVVVNATPYPYANDPGSLDSRSVEVDRAGSAAHTWFANAWNGPGAAQTGFIPYLEYGSHVNDGNGDSFLYRYPSPPVVDRIPESDGASWSNGGALLYNENDADGTVAAAVYASDGSYNEKVTYPNVCGAGFTCTLDVTVRPGGSARYAGSALAAGGMASIAIGPPDAGAIAFVVTYDGGQQQRFAVPAWFAPGEPLYAESDWIHADAAVPHACATSRYAGSTANAIVRRIVRIDPAAGTSETQETQTFTTPRYGTICVALSDQQLAYYDFANGRFSGTPIAAARAFEVLALASERLGGARPPVLRVAPTLLLAARFQARAGRLFKKPEIPAAGRI